MKASFDYIPSGLNFKFQNLSVGATDFLWDFGFASGDPAVPQTSADENPVIVFPNPGMYLVKLTASAGADTNTLAVWLVVSDDVRVNITIRQMAAYMVPQTTDTNAVEFSNLIKEWQLYLQPLVDTPYTIPPIDTFNEAKWPSIANQLISKLVAFDSVMTASRISLMGASGKGALKGMELGPSKAEWYDPSASLLALIKSEKAGDMQSITREICDLAEACGVHLPFCPSIVRVPFIVAKNCGPQLPFLKTYNPWPWRLS